MHWYQLFLPSSHQTSGIETALQQSSKCQSEVHDAATECVVNALYLSEDTRRHSQLANILQSGIYSTVVSHREIVWAIKILTKTTFQDAFNAAMREEDQDK